MTIAPEDGSLESIKVAVRMRPLVAHERGQQPCFEINSDHNEIVAIRQSSGQDHARDARWRFDHTMDSSDLAKPGYVSNYRCYKLVAQNMVQKALEGFNACLLCYGQTGTGKTTTILGDSQQGDGILVLLLRDLFAGVERAKRAGDSIKITISALEVYNEKIFDLLAKKQHGDHDGRRSVELHVLPSGVQIRNAEVQTVTSLEESLEIIAACSNAAHSASTYMNAHSSRGHSVYKLGIENHHGDGVHFSSELFFADLAGHENEKTTRVTGDHFVELSFINKSLMWLQHALHGLSTGVHDGHKEKHRHHFAQFRNSKLTLLLSNALTGNSRVSIIATLSPATSHFATSVSTLKFANEVKRIKTEVHATQTTDPGEKISALENEVKRLRGLLVAAAAGGLPGDESLPDENEKLRAEIKMLQLENAKLRDGERAGRTSLRANLRSGSKSHSPRSSEDLECELHSPRTLRELADRPGVQRLSQHPGALERKAHPPQVHHSPRADARSVTPLGCQALECEQQSPRSTPRWRADRPSFQSLSQHQEAVERPLDDPGYGTQPPQVHEKAEMHARYLQHLHAADALSLTPLSCQTLEYEPQSPRSSRGRAEKPSTQPLSHHQSASERPLGSPRHGPQLDSPRYGAQPPQLQESAQPPPVHERAAQPLQMLERTPRPPLQVHESPRADAWSATPPGCQALECEQQSPRSTSQWRADRPSAQPDRPSAREALERPQDDPGHGTQPPQVHEMAAELHQVDERAAQPPQLRERTRTATPSSSQDLECNPQSPRSPLGPADRPGVQPLPQHQNVFQQRESTRTATPSSSQDLECEPQSPRSPRGPADRPGVQPVPQHRKVLERPLDGLMNGAQPPQLRQRVQPCQVRDGCVQPPQVHERAAQARHVHERAAQPTQVQESASQPPQVHKRPAQPPQVRERAKTDTWAATPPSCVLPCDVAHRVLPPPAYVSVRTTPALKSSLSMLTPTVSPLSTARDISLTPCMNMAPMSDRPFMELSEIAVRAKRRMAGLRRPGANARGTI